MKSITLIKKQIQRKTNFNLVETINEARKHDKWKRIASILVGPRKNMSNLNLNEINKKIKENGTIIIPGKILSQGELTKKVKKIAAIGFSKKAEEKLQKMGCEIIGILEEIKKNPEAKDIEILK